MIDRRTATVPRSRSTSCQRSAKSSPRRRPAVAEMTSGGKCIDLRERYRRSLEAFIRGDPEPQKGLWSRRDDITLANPLGPPAKGYDRVCAVMDIAAAQIRDGEGMTL